MKYIDTHCHLNFKDFKADADEVISRTLAGETAMILVGSEEKTSLRAIDYADKYEAGVYAAVGLHPIHLEDIMVKHDGEEGKYEFHSREEKFDYEKYKQLALKSKKVVAIGEVGLDYFHIDKDKDEVEVKRKQQAVFKQFLLLAHELNLPLIIHCREAHEDLFSILKEFHRQYKKDSDKEWGVIHCFSGGEKLAEEYRKLNLMISFTGLITFAKNWDELIKNFPLEKMMIETDAPYMAPTPYRGQRNEPLYVQEVARKMGDLKGLSAEEVGEITFKNASRLFRI